MTRLSFALAFLFAGFTIAESPADDREYLRCIELKNTIENSATQMMEWFTGPYPTHPSKAFMRGRYYGLHESLIHLANDVGTTLCNEVRAMPTPAETEKK